METIAFIVLTVLALGSGAVVALGRLNAVVTALALVFNLVSIAGFFFLLDAQFIGFLQVIVYAGAIMVLILFVLMLLNIQDEERLKGARFFQRYLSPLLGLAFAAMVILAAGGASERGAFPEATAGYGTVKALGEDLFTRYFYPFEATSILLVVAMIGAVLLAKKKL